jgi:hypothetical protein
VSGLSPYLARSWLMSACCVEPITIEATTTGRGAGVVAFRTGGLAGLGLEAGFGAAVGLGSTIATSEPFEAEGAGPRLAASDGVLWECSRKTDAVPAATATKRISAPNQERAFTSR